MNTMKKTNAEAIVENLNKRFIEDQTSLEIKEKMEKAFLDGTLGNQDCIYNYPFSDEDVSSDPPDDRIELLNNFYDSIAQQGIIGISGYSGCAKCFNSYIDDLKLLAPFSEELKIVGHSIEDHLAYLYCGGLEIEWSLLNVEDTNVAKNGEIADFLHREVQRFGFGISEVSVINRTMYIIRMY
ncbi:MAG: hypothetical protein HOI42_12735 [Candidatus Marinimicrobia bacterium]|jgi:hypothetical protein|nr:hypothetical protein [Candidatus Neomarinimicrobiota bacterium]